MNRIVLVGLVAACGGSPASEPARPREPEKAAIAPPPPVPVIEAPPAASETPAAAEVNESAKPTDAASVDAKLWPSATASGFDVTDPTGAPARERLTGSVLLWADAKLYVAPKADAKSIQLANLTSRKDRPGEAWPMRVVGTKGDFVEVETPVQDELGNLVMDCAWFGLQTQMDVGRWRLFVRRADLAPVVIKKHAATFADGSKLELQPGVPVLPLSDGRWLVGMRTLWIAATLPAGTVGNSYPTPPLPKDEPFEPKFQLHATTVSLADTQAKLRGMHAPLAERVETKNDRVAFPLDDSCASATVIVAAADVRPYEPRDVGSGMGFGMGMGGMMGAERWYLPVGTTLVAEGGRATVKTRYEISLPKPTKGDKTVCIERFPFASSSYLFGPKLDDVDGNKLKMCAPARAVKHDKSKPFGKIGGFGNGKSLGLDSPGKDKKPPQPKN